MNILFLTMSVNMKDINAHGIYTDLLREFIKKQNTVYVVAPIEKREGKNTYITTSDNCSILNVKVGNVQKSNIIEKGVAQLRIEKQFIRAINKFYKDIKFDLIVYSTPPITFANVIKYIKKRDNAKTYLLLKDIFPQNAVDLGMFSKGSIFYKFFRRKEKILYEISDKIGCMSQANVDYVIKHNQEINPELVEICPNSIEVFEKDFAVEEKAKVRKKYGLPEDKKIFVYGGNLGKPQGIDFVIECIRSQKDNSDAYFLVVGSGTEYKKIEEFYCSEKQANFKLLSALPKNEYEILVNTCDVGMIFLDKRFTIPNFPSRLLSYMQAKMPVLAVTDVNTDVGQVIESGNFGKWSEAGELEGFCKMMREFSELTDEMIHEMGINGFEYLKKEYSVEKACSKIID